MTTSPALSTATKWVVAGTSDEGAGVRAQSGERTGYAHTDDLALPNLEEAARQARAIADFFERVGYSP